VRSRKSCFGGGNSRPHDLNPTEAGVRPDLMSYSPRWRTLKQCITIPSLAVCLKRARPCATTIASRTKFSILSERLILTPAPAKLTRTYSVCSAILRRVLSQPSYPLFEFLADLADVKLVPYPLLYDHGWQIDFDSLYKQPRHDLAP